VDSQIGQVQIAEPNRDAPAEIPVLIVGGGPVGLSTSLLLSHHGIRSLLVEQHHGTSTYPKARSIKARMMEIFRQLGIEQAIRAVAIPHNRNLIFARSLAGEELDRRPLETVLPEFVQNWSPTSGCTSPQDVVEPVLFEHARQNEQAQIRFNTQLASFEQRDDHVLATLVHRPSGRVQQVRTRYLIGADGSHSTVREALGIRMLGQPILSYYISMLFRADLARWVGDREINICVITNPEAGGLLLQTGENRWRFTAFYYPDRGQRPEDFRPERCLRVIRTATGVPDLAVELGEITPWNDAALVAERFCDRRIFLAGDAEHVMSPMGGFAMNVGLEDAHNLAWKLAAVLKGWAPPALLDSYQVERAPVSRKLIEHSARNSSPMHAANNGSANAGPAQPPWSRPELAREHGLVFGTTYDSAVIVPDGTAPVQVANPITDYAPNARPGSRAPHVWLDRSGERISTLDLFGREFVLLTGAQGQDWCDAAKEVSCSEGVPIQAFRIGSDVDLTDPGYRWATTYGVAEDGAVLVRPDGYVAWRCGTSKAEPETEIEMALSTALGRQAIPQRVIA
jgi:2-polyprenyl-6-methoxyphenol hydroxylase-like FAD-dependent oxidoreductase